MMDKKIISLIKGQIIRMDYATEKVESKIHKNDQIPIIKQEDIDYKELLKWYINNVEYHKKVILKHLNNIENKITFKARLETDNLIKNNIKE